CRLRRARSCIDWLGPWFAARAKPDWLDVPRGATDCWNWRIIRSIEAVSLEGEPASAGGTVARQGAALPAEAGVPDLTAPEFDELRARLTSSYPHFTATEQAAKSSVTSLRREAAEEPELAAPLARPKFPTARSGQLDAAAIGLAHHIFLQFLD